MKKKFFLALWAAAALAFLLLPLVSFAQTTETRSSLYTEINTNFADNTAGNITPAILRSTFSDMIASAQNPLTDGTAATLGASNTFSGATNAFQAITVTSIAATGTIFQNTNLSGPAPGNGGFGGTLVAEYVGQDTTKTLIVCDSFAQNFYQYFRRSDGTDGAKTALVSGDQMGGIGWAGYNGTAYTVGKAFVQVAAAENWSPTANGTNMQFDVVTPGTVTNIIAMELYGDGGLSVGGAVSATDPGTGNLLVAGNGTFDGVLSETNSIAGTGNNLLLGNTNGGVTALSNIGLSNGTNTLQLVQTGTAYAGTYLSGGPTGQGAFLVTSGAVPLTLGTNNLAALNFDTNQGAKHLGAVSDHVTVLTYASPTSVNPTLGNVFTVTTVNATGSVTFNASSAGSAGQHVWIYILNDATSGKTITWGTNFDAQATTLVGISSKGSMIEFLSDGTSLREVSRVTGLL